MNSSYTGRPLLPSAPSVRMSCGSVPTAIVLSCHALSPAGTDYSSLHCPPTVLVSFGYPQSSKGLRVTQPWLTVCVRVWWQAGRYCSNNLCIPWQSSSLIPVTPEALKKLQRSFRVLSWPEREIQLSSAGLNRSSESYIFSLQCWERSRWKIALQWRLYLTFFLE